MDYAELVKVCDEEIKRGQPKQVARRLYKLNATRVPREWRLPLARICRRAGLYSLGLHLLVKIALATRQKPNEEITDAEMAEYGVLLLRSGALSEGLEKLGRVNTDAVPEALLYRAFAHFARWEFDQAVPIIENYLRANLTSYAAQTGRTNLAFALVESRKHEAALKLLDENIRIAAESGHTQQQSNALALRGQVFAQEGDFKAARAEFAKAQKLFGDSQTNDQLFAQKWNLILSGLELKSVKPFNELRSLAQSKNSWETWREADLFSLKVEFNRERFVHLYFGSPYDGFRQRIVAELGIPAPTQPIYVLGLKSSPRMDLRTGKLDGVEVLNPGRKCHQVLDLLLHDFYRPVRIAGLFSEMFPQEQFNISSSPHRVRQILSRTRAWIKAEGYPIEINESGGFYSLNINGPFSFRVPLERRTLVAPHLQLEKLKQKYPADLSFSINEACEFLKLSNATVHRLIHRGLEDGKVKRVGKQGQAVIFKIAS